MAGGNDVGLFQTVEGSIQDLNVTGSITITPDGASIGMLAGFTDGGTFTNVHTSGTVSASGVDNVGGLFGGASCGASISLSSSSVDVTGNDSVGGLVGTDGCEGPGVTITGSSATGTVTGNQKVGGLIGGSYYSTINTSFATGDVTGTIEVGGFVGYYDNTSSEGEQKIFQSYATGDVYGNEDTGGFVGQLDNGIISQSYALGNVLAGDGDNVGGFVGYITDGGLIRNSYARGNVSHETFGGDTGGFVGQGNSDAEIHASYSTGTASNGGGESYQGGFAGYVDSTNLESVFWDVESSGTEVGCGDDECAAVGESTANMKQQSTFTDAGWNFDTIWTFSGGINNDYAILIDGADDEMFEGSSSVSVNPVETILDENQFHNVGDPQGWSCDDCENEYELPFTFNYYGQDYSSVFVSSNGFISFGEEADDYDFRVQDWNGNPLIVAFSGDLDTECEEGDDIYISQTDDTVIFRWQAADHGSCGVLLNFEIVLHSDGSFEINYGDMGDYISLDESGMGSVGVTNGENAYRLSEYTMQDDFNNVNTSAWSWEASSVEDDDGVDGAVEDAAPNEGDANDDGTPDNEQPKVTSLVSPVSGSYVVLESDSCTANSSVSINSESSNGVQDGSYNYPLGLLNFTLTGCSVGVTETITQYYYGSYDVSKLVVRKYNETTDTYATITGAVITAVTIGGRSAVKVVYTVTDGGALDADGIANGTIVDPAGIAVLGAASPNTGYAKVASSLGYAPLGLLTLGLYAYIRRYAKR